MAEFTPEYLSIDYTSLIEKFKTELRKSDVFKDYDFEGSNISILMELNAYVSELNTFFINKIAKNNFLETADVYEAANRLARQQGYEAKGTRSARCTIQVGVSGTQAGDVLRVLPWKQLNSGRTDPDGNSILFATTASIEVTAGGSWTYINVPIRQGEILTLTGYTGDDLIDNELILPTEYGYDDDLTDDYPSLRVTIGPDGNQTEWTRLSDFYLDVLTPNSDDVYMFIYDRYRRNKIVFNQGRNVPIDTDTITIKALDSLGINGSIGADDDETWVIESDELIELTRGITTSNLENDLITISLSAASIGAAAAETIDEIKFNAQSALRAQFRNVNANAYNSYLSARSDIVKANAYGEQDLVPSGAGDPQEYNVVHISVIPEVYGNATIQTSAGSFTTDWGGTGSILVPTQYSSSWNDELLLYLRPRKMICSYEIMEVPDLVYFSFEIGIRKKRIYEFVDIQQDVLAKLIYYFREENQAFNSEIDFNDIQEYLIDTTEVSPSDNFEYIKGIRNLNIRDINVSKTVYEYNANPDDSSLYPKWTIAPWSNRDNMLRPIQIGLNQFPYLSSDTVRIVEET
jgi:hypothetical protein